MWSGRGGLKEGEQETEGECLPDINILKTDGYNQGTKHTTAEAFDKYTARAYMCNIQWKIPISLDLFQNKPLLVPP